MRRRARGRLARGLRRSRPAHRRRAAAGLLRDWRAGQGIAAPLVWLTSAAAWQAEALHAADLVLAAGRTLAAPHAAAWRRMPAPAAVCAGYAGAIDARVDLALVALLADARPEWQFVFVVPLDDGVLEHPLPRRSNIVWAGAQPYCWLPRWMSAWRLALLPCTRTPATRALQPLPVFEALAAGLPVVAPPLAWLRASGQRP